MTQKRPSFETIVSIIIAVIIVLAVFIFLQGRIVTMAGYDLEADTTEDYEPKIVYDIEENYTTQATPRMFIDPLKEEAPVEIEEIITPVVEEVLEVTILPEPVVEEPIVGKASEFREATTPLLIGLIIGILITIVLFVSLHKFKKLPVESRIKIKKPDIKLKKVKESVKKLEEIEKKLSGVPRHKETNKLRKHIKKFKKKAKKKAN